MGLKVVCEDLELTFNCPYVARGEDTAELTEDIGKHDTEVHGYTYEQLHTREMVEKVKAKAKRA